MMSINKTLSHVSAAFLIASASAGCVMDDGGTPVPPPVKDAINDEPTELTIDIEASRAYADGRPMDLESGSVVLSIGHHDKLGIDSLDVRLGTMVVQGEDPALDGIEL